MAEDDSDLAALVRAAGTPARPPASVESEVRAVVEAEWRGVVAARRRRRTVAGWSVAASVLVAAFALWTVWRPSPSPNEAIASFARIEGEVSIRDGEDGAWKPAEPSARLRPGAEIQTGSTGKVAVELGDGLDMRVDSASQLDLVDLRHMRLLQGAAYVDSGAGGESRDLEIATPFGSIRHLGTQYEARLRDAGLRVAVREGRVQVGADGVTAVAAAGEQLLVSDTGVVRSPLPTDAAEWNWISDVTPPIAIEGKSLAEFLTWAGRQTGRKVDYASPEVARRAHDIVLRGSVAGLTPDQAVRAVISTTPLQTQILGNHIRVEDAKL